MKDIIENIVLIIHICLSLGDGHHYHANYMSESSPSIRTSKLNIEQPILNVSNPSSPQINRRASPIPQSASPSFTNPFQEQQNESNHPLEKESETKDQIVVGTLLDITVDDAQNQSQSQSQSITLTNTENELFNLDIGTHIHSSTPTVKTTDLLGVDFNSMSLDKPILHRNASEITLPAPLQATTVLKTETKSSSNQNINRVDPFKDLYFSSSTTQKTSSNESINLQKPAGNNMRDRNVAHT